MKIKYLPLILALFTVFEQSSSAQTCFDNITLNTQAEVDSFQITYGCDSLYGFLGINGTDIENLDSLYSLTYVDRYIKISDNEFLTSLEGLNNITIIKEDFELINNPAITSLEDLKSLTYIGNDLFIRAMNITDLNGLQNLETIQQGLGLFENPNLVNLDSMRSITTIGTFIYVIDNPELTQVDSLINIGPVAQYIDFSQNASLQNIDGVANAAVSLSSHLSISNNDMITNIDSLYNLTYIGGSLRISNNDNLENLNGFGNLETLDGTLYIRNNESLASIDSLLNLTYIGEHLWIERNPTLVDLYGLSNVTEIRGYLRMKLNDLLPSIEPLSNVDTIYSFVEIIDNSDLSSCCIVKCWPYDVTQSSITIQNNEDNCNSMIEIYDVCDTTLCSGKISLVEAKVYLEGPYREELGGMHTELNDLDMDIIAVRQPYQEEPYNYSGGEIVSIIPPEMVDWVLVEARVGEPNITGSRGTQTIETKAGLLLNDGTIVGPDGLLPLQFFYLNDSTEYRFCIRHRNHLDILSADPVLGTDTVTYDFTGSQDASFSFEQTKLVAPGVFAMYVGDYNQDHVIQSTDIDLWLVDPAILNTYSQTDGNIDGVIQVTDFDKWFFNKAKVGSIEISYE